MLKSKLDHLLETCFIKRTVSDRELRTLEEKSFQDLSSHIESKYSEPYRRNTIYRKSHKKENKHEKNDEHSAKLRESGNVQFSRKQFDVALSLYYEALKFAESPKNRALCYGNISAVLFNMKNYKRSLIAIEKVKENYDTNDNFLAKILTREKRCRCEFQDPKSQKSTNKLFLKYPKNPKNSEVVNCIGAGGGVFAKKDMKAGDIIAFSDPFTVGPYDKIDLSCEPIMVCKNCHKSLIEVIAIPCENCAQALYCNEDCKTEDLSFHKFFCQNGLTVSKRPHFEMMALKFALKVLSKGIDIRKEEFKNSKTTCFDWDEDNFENRVKSACSLKTIKINNTVKVDTYVEIFIILRDLKKSEDFKKLLSTFENGDELFLKTYLKGYELVYFNFFSSLFNTRQLLDATHFDLIRGSFNHSCSPNAVVYSHAKTGFSNFYTLISNVKSGEEITVSYGGTFHYSYENPKRQLLLKTYFGLDCKCKACCNLVPEDDAGIMHIIAFEVRIKALLNVKEPLTNKEYESLVDKFECVEAVSAKVLILLNIFNAFFTSQDF